MKLNEEFKAGNKIYILKSRYNSQTKRTETSIEEQTITDVGRKYVTVGRYDKFYRPENHEKELYLTSWCSYRYDRDIAFATRKQAEEYLEGQQLIQEIRNRMTVIGQQFDQGKIKTEQLREISSILDC